MKIIRIPGIPTPFVTMHKPGCGATLEVVPGDIVRHGEDRDGPYVVVRCAHCDEEMLLSYMALPHDWNVRELGRRAG